MENIDTLVALTADIVAAHVSNNSVSISDIATLIGSVHTSLSGLGQGPEPEPQRKQKPAVSIRASIKPDHLVCLEDGKRVIMLKSYLRTNFNMTPAEYRAKWKLPYEYPMVAPDYTARRSQIAKSTGLGKSVRGDRPKKADSK